MNRLKKTRTLLGLTCLWLACHAAHAQSNSRIPRRNPHAQPDARSPFDSQNPLRQRRSLTASSNDPPVALQGFCPVSLRDRQEWSDGDRRITAVLDGQTYRLAGEREHARFVAAPLRYAPALGGDCPVVFLEESKRSRGAVQYGLIHGGRAYFFASAENREKFRSNPERYVDADLALDGHCPVRWVDTNRRVPGREDATLIVAGIRYRFAGLNEQQRFVANAADYLVESPQPSWALRGLDPGSAIASQSANPFRPSYQNDSGQRSAQSSMPQQDTTTMETLDANNPSSLAFDPSAAAISRPQSGAAPDLSPSNAEPMLQSLCPVSIVENANWERGLDDVSATYDQRYYLFASEELRDKFLADPYLYVPALRGACVVTYAKGGGLVKGSVHHTRECTKTGRLYLLASESEAAVFDASPEKFLDIDLFHAGTCIVSLVEEGKPIAGNPQIGIWYRGQRYTFESAEKRDRFMEAPEEYLASAGDVLPASGIEQVPDDEVVEEYEK